MKEHIIRVSCDHCLAENGENTRTEARTTQPISLFRGKYHTLDLCEVYEKELVGLREFLAEKGVPPTEAEMGGKRIARPKVTQPTLPMPVAEGQDRACPLCGVVLRRTSLPSHLYDRHGDGSRPTYSICPDCGKDCRTFQGLAIHRTKMKDGLHDYDGAAEALDYVKGLTR